VSAWCRRETCAVTGTRNARRARLRPYGITITGGDRVVHEDAFHVRVPKRELVGLLVALFQSGRLKVARDLELASVLINELINIRVTVNMATGHDSYEAWRESVHDDLVLATGLLVAGCPAPPAEERPAQRYVRRGVARDPIEVLRALRS
jgi:hypothetical protein